MIEMSGWTRGTLWPATARPWVATSPNIPTFETALIYAGTCLFEGTIASEGRGTPRPFLTLGAPWIDADRLAADLNGRNLPGVRFRAVRYTPVLRPGAVDRPNLMAGQLLRGVEIDVTNAGAVEPVALGVHALDAFLAQAQNRVAFFQRPEAFDRLAGTPRLRLMLTRGDRPETILAAMRTDVQAFEAHRRAYLLYP